MLRTSFIFGTAALVAVCGADNCQYSGCNDCTSQPRSNGGGCGFCATSGTCVFGTSSGPLTGGCSDWDWTPSECPAATPVPLTPSPPTPLPAPPLRSPPKNARPWQYRGGGEKEWGYRNVTLGEPLQPWLRWKLKKGFTTGFGSPGASNPTVGGGFVFALLCDQGLSLNFVNATTGDIAATVSVATLNSQSCPYTAQPLYSESRNRVYVLWAHTPHDSQVATIHYVAVDINGTAGEPYVLFSDSWTPNNSPVQGVLTNNGFYYEDTADQLHFVYTYYTPDYTWVVVNASSGKVVATSNFNGKSGSNGVRAQFAKLSHSNGGILMAALNGRNFAAWSIGFKTLAWTWTQPLESGMTFSGSTPLMTFPENNTFFVCTNSYPNGGGSTSGKCTMYGVDQGIPTPIWNNSDMKQTEMVTDGRAIFARDANGYNNSPYKQYDVNSGEKIPGAPSYAYEQRTGNGYFPCTNRPLLTNDYLMQTCGSYYKYLYIWDKETGQLLNSANTPGLHTFEVGSGCALSLYGGWVYCQQEELLAVQLQASVTFPPPTPSPPTPQPPTPIPPTPVPPTPVPTTPVPTTPVPTTPVPPTPVPSTPVPTTPVPTTETPVPGSDTKDKFTVTLTSGATGLNAIGDLYAVLKNDYQLSSSDITLDANSGLNGPTFTFTLKGSSSTVEAARFALRSVANGQSGNPAGLTCVKVNGFGSCKSSSSSSSSSPSTSSYSYYFKVVLSSSLVTAGQAQSTIESALKQEYSLPSSDLSAWSVSYQSGGQYDGNAVATFKIRYATSGPAAAARAGLENAITNLTLRGDLGFASCERYYPDLNAAIAAGLGTLLIIIVAIAVALVVCVIAIIVCCCCCTAKAVADASAPPPQTQVVYQQHGGAAIQAAEQDDQFAQPMNPINNSDQV